MDTTRLDRITKAMAGKSDRRDLLRLLGLGALAAGSLSRLGPDDAGARKRPNRRKKKRKKTCNGKCGGKCPRCIAGSTCENRGQCTTAFCENNECTEPNNNGQCGLDTDGVNGCFRRDNLENGESYCSRQLCRFIADGSCNQCKGSEICSPAGGDDIECCAPCGSPL